MNSNKTTNITSIWDFQTENYAVSFILRNSINMNELKKKHIDRNGNGLYG